MDEADRRILELAAGAKDDGVLSWLREEAPVHNLGGRGLWILSRRRDCETILQDPRLRGGKVRMEYLLGAGPDGALPTLEGIVSPEDDVHDRTRAAVRAAITPHVITKFKHDTTLVVRDSFRRVIERSDGRSRLLRVGDDLAFSLLVRVMARLIGLPPDRDDELVGWVRVGALGATKHADPESAAEANQAARDCKIFTQQVVRARRREPQDDLISALWNAVDEEGAGSGSAETDGAGPDGAETGGAGPDGGETDGGRSGPLTRADITKTVLLMLGASVETMTAAVDGMFEAFADHPDQYQQLRTDVEGRRAAVEEVFRWTSPGAFSGRTVIAPLTIGDAELEAGDSVLALLAAANRDPDDFTDPQRFDITRWPNPHLSFAVGPMRCVGAALARIEMRILLDELAECFSAIEPVELEPVVTPEPVPTTTVRIELARR